MPAISASAALAGIRVLDLSRVRAGPACARVLADFGADVIRVEPPPGVDPNETMGGPRHGADFQNLNRNKRSLALNLKQPEGMAVFRRLAQSADVVIENFRPDVKARLGIDYAGLCALNPRIILASISGFGQTGPYRDRPGFDQIAQGMGGFMAITGFPDQGPVRAGAAIADVTAGTNAAIGVLVALFERTQSGRGQWVQSSLLHSQIALTDFQAARFLMTGEVPVQAGNDHPTIIPTGVFPTADGHVNIAIAGEGQWRALCTSLGLPELIADPDFADNARRSKNRTALNARLAQVTGRQRTADLMATLGRHSIAAGPIYRMDQVFADPQVEHLGVAATVEHPRLGAIRLVANPVILERTPATVATASPDAGADTDEVLREAGYLDHEIEQLRQQGAIA